MEMNSTAVATRPKPGRPYAWLGFAAAVLGPVIYTIQLSAKVLAVPWYAPVLATMGLALSLVALLRAQFMWRYIGLGFCGLLAAFQWVFVLSSTLPAYTGPAAAGQTIPEFSASQADGTRFDRSDLVGEQNTAMVFFRGRW